MTTLPHSLTSVERSLMMTLPKRDFVLKSSKGLGDAYLRELAIEASLRQRGLITIRLDWDASSATHVARHLALTPAGVAALHPEAAR
jgi:hypothetical protein